jgi:hypothetical protein
MELLVRRRLTQDGQLSEPLVRRAASALATLLAGGENGFSWNYGTAAGKGYDPDRWFLTVTEGRQSTWKTAEGKRRSYSACEDLPGAVYLRVLGCPPTPEELTPILGWCNRVEAGNKWQMGANLRRIRTRMHEAWKLYGPGAAWDIAPGDAVQVMGKFAHTFIVTDLRYEAGRPTVCDHADYGQFHKPAGARRDDHSCRCHRDAAVTSVDRVWCINGKPILGRINVWELVRRVYDAQGDTPLPAWVPPDFVGGLDTDNPYLPERA